MERLQLRELRKDQEERLHRYTQYLLKSTFLTEVKIPSRQLRNRTRVSSTEESEERKSKVLWSPGQILSL